jgi:hypothetical protein
MNLEFSAALETNGSFVPSSLNSDGNDYFLMIISQMTLFLFSLAHFRHHSGATRRRPRTIRAKL